MTWKLRWQNDTRDDLARSWLDASDRNAVTIAIDAAEKALAANGTRDAKPITEGLWRFDTPPLRIYFSVDESRQIIRI